jgi:hypothetical protein
MESVSTRLNTETHRLVRETADEQDASLAEVLRELVEKGLEYDKLERENERLQRERRQILGQREERNELVAYVEEERELQRRREEREQRREQRRHANVFRRMWWKLAGTPDDEIEA